MELTIYTYGGSEILSAVFNAVSMLMNGNTGSLFRPIMIIGASIGSVWSLSKAFFSPSAEAFFGKFIIPMLVIPSLLLIPTTTVRIVDAFDEVGSARTVENVPWALGKFSQLVSTLGYRVTVAVDVAMHKPKNANYAATGMIFGAENAMDMRHYQLTDANTEHNLKAFSKQCVLYDIALGLYSVDELKKSTDIWSLFEKKTSKSRMMPYREFSKETDDQKPAQTNIIYCSCQDAVKKMSAKLDESKAYYTKNELFKHLPVVYQSLTGISKDAGSLIGQQLVMSTVAGEFSKEKFAASRAAAQQRSIYSITGAVAGKSLVTLRIVLEALIYFSFIFVMPMSLLPGGLRYIGKWLFLVVWIQLWPPFYAALNYIMEVSASAQVTTLLAGLCEDQRGLSLFTSVGLRDIHESTQALSGYLSMAIPFLSYAIVSGGAQSFVHLAGSLMAPAQTAASTAAQEATTGNHSFGNVSMGGVQYGNTSAFQRNTAGSLASGFMTENTGSESVTHSGDGMFLDQKISSLSTKLNVSEGVSSSLSASYTDAQSRNHAANESLSKSVAVGGKSIQEVATRFSSSNGISDSLQEKNEANLGKSAADVLSLVDQEADSLGIGNQISRDLRAEAAFRAGCGIQFGKYGNAGFDTRFSGARADSDIEEKMNQLVKNLSSNEQFTKSFGELVACSESTEVNATDDKNESAAYSFSRSFDESKQHLDSISKSRAEMEQISKAQSKVSNLSASDDENLTQEFVNFVVEKEGSQSLAREILGRSSTDPELMSYKKDFFERYRDRVLQNANSSELIEGFVSQKREKIESSYNKDFVENIDVEGEKKAIREGLSEKLEFHEEKLEEARSGISSSKKDLHNKFKNKENLFNMKNAFRQKYLSNRRDKIHDSAVQKGLRFVGLAEDRDD